MKYIPQIMVDKAYVYGIMYIGYFYAKFGGK